MQVAAHAKGVAEQVYLHLPCGGAARASDLGLLVEVALDAAQIDDYRDAEKRQKRRQQAESEPQFGARAHDVGGYANDPRASLGRAFWQFFARLRSALSISSLRRRLGPRPLGI